MSPKATKKLNLLPDQPNHNHLKDPNPDPTLPKTTSPNQDTPLPETEESLRLKRIQEVIILWIKANPTKVTAALTVLLPGGLAPAILAASALASDGVYSL